MVSMFAFMTPAGLVGNDQAALSIASVSGRSRERGADEMHLAFKIRARTPQSRLVEDASTKAAEES